MGDGRAVTALKLNGIEFKAIICVGGALRVIEISGEPYVFEDRHMFGPCPVDKYGKERPLGPRHPFWRAVTAWYDQGKERNGGLCQWSEPPDPWEDFVHVAGRHWVHKNSKLLDRFPPSGRKHGGEIE